MLKACAAWEEKLSAYLDNELPYAEHAEVEAHLFECATCRAAVEVARCDAQDTAAVLNAPQASAGFADRVMAQVAVTAMVGEAAKPKPAPASWASKVPTAQTAYAATSWWGSMVKIVTVCVLVSIVALIVMPRTMGAGRKAKEATLRSNLQRMGRAIAQFQADTGVWPHELKDIVASADSNPTGCPSGKYKGPYLTPNGGVQNTGIPANPYGDSTAPIETHWVYDNANGSVTSAIAGKTLDGVDYRELGSRDGDSSGIPPQTLDLPRGANAGTPEPRPATPPNITPPTKDYGLPSKPHVAYAAEVGLQSADVRETMNRTEQAFGQFNGFVLNAAYAGGDATTPPTATVTGRVPTAKLNELLIVVDKLGGLTKLTVQGEDLTAKHLEHLDAVDSLHGDQAWQEHVENTAKSSADRQQASQEHYKDAGQLAGTRRDEYQLQARVVLADVSVTIAGTPPPASSALSDSAGRAWHALTACCTWLAVALFIPLLVWLPLWGPLLGIVLLVRRRYVRRDKLE